MSGMSLEPVRQALDAAPSTDTATLARAARNAIAQAVLAEALSPEAPTPAEPPVAALRERFGPELAEKLAAVYAGGRGWTAHAIDALEPLHALARA
jgi:hypothetical protein